jgi:hypothetical protein
LGGSSKITAMRIHASPPWLIGEKRRGELWAKDMYAIIK